jgi:ADP-ribosylglycohydrolase
MVHNEIYNARARQTRSSMTILGAMVGDIIGSSHEHGRVKSRDFPLFTADSRFTDDTVLTAAVASAIIDARRSATGATPDYHSAVLAFARKWPHAGYGGNFRKWIHSSDPRPYNSWGNGSAMRVSPVGFAFDDEASVLREAERSAAITHDHPEGIKAAQAVALGVLLARQGNTKAQIRTSLTDHFGYDLDRTTEDIRPGYHFEVSAQKSVPEAVIAFLDSHDFESAIRNAVWLGGDADTQACIAGALAEAHYGGVPAQIASDARERLPVEILRVVDAFNGMTA